MATSYSAAISAALLALIVVYSRAQTSPNTTTTASSNNNTASNVTTATNNNGTTTPATNGTGVNETSTNTTTTTPTTPSLTPSGKPRLHIAQFLPDTDTTSQVYKRVTAAAIDLINKDPELLPGYEIEVEVYDTNFTESQENYGKGLKLLDDIMRDDESILNFTRQPARVKGKEIMLFGPGDNTEAQHIPQFATGWHAVQIAHSVDDPTQSDRSSYPHFFRLAVPLTAFESSHVTMVLDYFAHGEKSDKPPSKKLVVAKGDAWKQVAVLYQSTPFSSKYGTEMNGKFQGRDIKVLMFTKFESIASR